MSATARLLQAAKAADMLGVSTRLMYDLAAPNGPIPCFRIGGRVLFSETDLSEYLESCRFTKTQRAVVSSLSSTPVLKAGESALEKYCRKHGLEPKRKASNRKSVPDSTPRSATVSVLPIALKKP